MDHEGRREVASRRQRSATVNSEAQSVRSPVPAIDIVTGVQTPEVAASRPAWSKGFFGGKIGAGKDDVLGVPIEAYIERMDACGIERSILFAQKAGPQHDPESFRLDPRVVSDIVERYPDRFSGIIGLDPTQGMDAVRELESAVRDHGFIGAHGYPHWFGLAPDDRRWYPIYSKCVELDVPIQLQVGHCLVYSEKRPLKSVGRPITLDTVACDFPELKLIGIHIGWPWTEEMIAVAYKHRNVYIGSDAYGPKHWDPSFVRFINSWGSKKVLFGTDYPVIDPERAVREILELGLRPESLQRFMRDNARELYKI
jgi:predicted TIM-barrel fold metal-dependent hydrolase